MRQCVSHVKVKSVVYRYNRPPCVDQFFDLPPAVVESGRTSVRCSSFSASVWITGFTYVNSCDDYPENTGLGFTKYEEATETVPLVARSRAFRRRRQLIFQLVVPVREPRLPSTAPFVLDNDHKGIVTMNGVSYDVPWGAERCCSWKATPGLALRASLGRSVHLVRCAQSIEHYVCDACFTLFRVRCR